MSNFKELVRLGKDAELRRTQQGKPVVGFRAAYDLGWGDRKKTEWVSCSWWGDRATKVVEYLVKGAQILIEGDIGTREHDGKTYLEVDVREVKLVGGKRDDGDTERQSAPTREKPPQTPARQTVPADTFEDSEIPF